MGALAQKRKQRERELAKAQGVVTDPGDIAAQMKSAQTSPPPRTADPAQRIAQDPARRKAQKAARQLSADALGAPPTGGAGAADRLPSLFEQDPKALAAAQAAAKGRKAGIDLISGGTPEEHRKIRNALKFFGLLTERPVTGTTSGRMPDSAHEKANRKRRDH